MTFENKESLVLKSVENANSYIYIEISNQNWGVRLEIFNQIQNTSQSFERIYFKISFYFIFNQTRLSFSRI